MHAVYQPHLVEIEQQPDRHIEQFHVAQCLRLMNR